MACTLNGVAGYSGATTGHLPNDSQTEADEAGAGTPPIGAAEARIHLEWIQRALEAGSDEEREALLGEGFLEFGHRFGQALSHLASLEADQGTEYGPFARLSEEGLDVFAAWIAGRRLSDRVDEPERRAYAARLMLGGGSGLERIAAKAVLELPEGHPDRDVDAAREALMRVVEQARKDNDPEALALAADTLLDEELLPVDQSISLLETALGRLDEVEQPDIQHDLRLAGINYYSQRAIEARDEGDEAGQQAWLARARPLLDVFLGDPREEDEDTARKLLVAGMLLAVGEDAEAAAGTFARVVDSTGADETVGLLAAMHEARLRLARGEYERVAQILHPRLRGYAEAYLTALTDDDIQSNGSNFADVIENAVVADARLGRWGAAVQVLELGKSLRFRHRAALRRSPAGRRLLRLEGELYGVSRNRPASLPRTAASRDFLGTTLSASARLLEAYRRARPEVPPELLEGPSVAAIAGSLRRGEAAVLLGLTSAGTLIAVVRPDDTDAPSAAVIEESWPWRRWLELFGSDDEPSWAYALADDQGVVDGRAALDRLLAGVEDALAPLREMLDRPGIERVVVVPHRLLHLVPFQAAAPLRGRDLLTAPSVALLVGARSRRRPPRARRCLVVANPTLDLPAAVAEAVAVCGTLEEAGIGSDSLEGAAATRAALSEALREATGVLHFCGHGDSDLVDPARSALKLHPGAELPDDAGDPFARWAAEPDDWEELADGEGRWADLPGVGRLVELRSDDDALAARRLEYSSGATLEGTYADGRLIGTADAWTAGEVMVQEPLRSCQLVVLSACDVGAGGLGLGIDELAGLPAALQLAGARSVVSTLWPISDALTALQVELLYELLTEHPDTAVDLAAVMRRLGEHVRRMDVAEAGTRLEQLRAGTDDPMARIVLEAYAARLAERGPHPFEHPYDWATFQVVGAGEASWRTSDAGTRRTARAGAR